MKVTNKRKIYCYHRDEDASWDPRSVETRSYAKRRDSTHITPFTDRRGYAQWPSSLVCTRCNQRHPLSDGAGNTRYQTTRAPQEDMAPTDEGRHGGCGCYPGCGPRPEGVEKEGQPQRDREKATKISKVSIFHFKMMSRDLTITLIR